MAVDLAGDVADDSVASANATEEQSEAGSIAPKNEVKVENAENDANGQFWFSCKCHSN